MQKHRNEAEKLNSQVETLTKKNNSLAKELKISQGKNEKYLSQIEKLTREKVSLSNESKTSKKAAKKAENGNNKKKNALHRNLPTSSTVTTSTLSKTEMLNHAELHSNQVSIVLLHSCAQHVLCVSV